MSGYCLSEVPGGCKYHFAGTPAVGCWVWKLSIPTEKTGLDTDLIHQFKKLPQPVKELNLKDSVRSKCHISKSGIFGSSFFQRYMQSHLENAIRIMYLRHKRTETDCAISTINYQQFFSHLSSQYASSFTLFGTASLVRVSLTLCVLTQHVLSLVHNVLQLLDEHFLF